MRGPHDSTGDEASLILTPPPSPLSLDHQPPAHPSRPPLERQISKTRRYTNVVCCPDMFNAIVSPRTRGPWRKQGSSFAGGRMQRVHRREFIAEDHRYPDSCSVGYSPALSPAPHSLSHSSLLLLSVPFPLRPTLSLSLSLSLSPKKGGSGRSVYLYPPRGSNHPLQDRRGVVYPLGHDDWVSAPGHTKPKQCYIHLNDAKIARAWPSTQKSFFQHLCCNKVYIFAGSEFNCIGLAEK